MTSNLAQIEVRLKTLLEVWRSSNYMEVFCKAGCKSRLGLAMVGFRNEIVTH
jgi:hypothetical protein